MHCPVSESYYIDRDVASNFVHPSINKPEDSLPGEANALLIEFGKKEVGFHLDTLEKHYLSERKFLCGNKPCFADSWVSTVLSLLELVQFDLQSWPKVKAWMAAMTSSSAYVDVSYDHEERVRKLWYKSQNRVLDVEKESN